MFHKGVLVSIIVAAVIVAYVFITAVWPAIQAAVGVAQADHRRQTTPITRRR